MFLQLSHHRKYLQGQTILDQSMLIFKDMALAHTRLNSPILFSMCLSLPMTPCIPYQNLNLMLIYRDPLVLTLKLPSPTFLAHMNRLYMRVYYMLDDEARMIHPLPIFLITIE
jgi:hypothetical protein